MAIYRINKSRAILLQCYRSYRKHKNRLSPTTEKDFKSLALELQDAILTLNREKADHYARLLQTLSKDNFNRSTFQQLFESTIAIGTALLIAVVIRQTTFEPFEIPSGSMRPTYKEQDRLVVSKTQFGLNVPLTTKHLFFKPDEIKRMGVIVFTGEGMDIHNVKTRYFYLFPGYRQYIKRMIGLPGDQLYFYGGKIFGVDKDGNNITQDLQLDSLDKLEHIPFMHLEGKTVTPKAPVNDVYSPIILHQMNMPIAKLYLSSKRNVEADFLLKPDTTNRADLEKFDLYKLWGMENYANARILRKSALAKKTSLEAPLTASDYYLELTHHQSAAHPTINKDAYYRTRPSVTVEKSYIPLNEDHLKKIWSHIYTGRFIVENGYLRRYGVSSKEAANNSFLPKLKGGIPDGTYEFTDGKLYEIKTQGMTYLAAKDHPLAQFTSMRLFTLFNAGIECDIRFLPVYHDQTILPSRYAYFRDGDLYLMGAKVLDKNSKVITEYIEGEKFKEERVLNYIPFVDRGAPVKEDGSLDLEMIKTYGLRVPAKHYFVLGDNHAMSGDSRDFGFVPESNLRGIPSFIFWGPDNRVGFPNGSTYPFFTMPRILIWLGLLAAYGIYVFVQSKMYSLPLRFKDE